MKTIAGQPLYELPPFAEILSVRLKVPESVYPAELARVETSWISEWDYVTEEKRGCPAYYANLLGNLLVHPRPDREYEIMVTLQPKAVVL